MSKLKYLLNLFILVSLFSFSSCNSNSDINAATSQENQAGLTVTGDCDVVFDPQTNEIKLVSDLTVGPESRARCIIRVESPSPYKQVRLVPIAVKGEVTKAPATLSISSILVGGDDPTSVSKLYNSPTSFDLTDQIPSTDYTTEGQSVFGINLIVSTNEGSLEITDLKFAIQ